jgi:hypothetical protein
MPIWKPSDVWRHISILTWWKPFMIVITRDIEIGRAFKSLRSFQRYESSSRIDRGCRSGNPIPEPPFSEWGTHLPGLMAIRACAI